MLERVVNPWDLLSCYQAVPLWMSLLEPDKSTWQFNLAFPSLFKYLRKNDVLKCRLVCNKWRSGVDKFLEHDQFKLYNSTTHFLFRKTVELNFAGFDEDTAAVERFRDEMKNSKRNPIISRSIHVGDHPNVVPFLSEFGVHIWHLTISVFPEEGSPVDFVRYLRKLLICCPNLRTFQLMGYMNDEGGRDPDIHVEADLIQHFFDENPLPLLPRLETLDIRLRDIHTIDQTVILIEQQVLSCYGHQLVKLFLGHNILLNNPFAKMTDLSIMIHSAEQLQYLQDLESPLEVLDLIIHTSQLNFRKMFRTIERFRSSLKVLSIRFYSQYPRRIEFGKSVQFPKRVRLPFLQELKLEDVCARSDMSFDFLRSLRGLRRIELQFSTYCKLDDEPRRRERVLVNQHLDEYGKGTEFGMYFSNIWRLLPHLEKVILWHIRHRYRRVFSRNFYEYLQEQFTKRIFEEYNILAV